MRFLFGPFGETYEVLERHDGSDRARVGSVPTAIDRGTLRSLVEEPRNDFTLRQILHLDGRQATILPSAERLEQLHSALARGNLTLRPSSRPATASIIERAPEIEDDESAILLASLARSWVEVELVDSDGLPVSGVAYEIRLPDGRTITSKTDQRGRGSIEDTQPGECTITFPELDQSSWARE